MKAVHSAVTSWIIFCACFTTFAYYVYALRIRCVAHFWSLFSLHSISFLTFSLLAAHTHTHIHNEREEIQFLINNASSQLFNKYLEPGNTSMCSVTVTYTNTMALYRAVPAILHDQTWKNPAASSLYTVTVDCFYVFNFFQIYYAVCSCFHAANAFSVQSFAF